MKLIIGNKNYSSRFRSYGVAVSEPSARYIDQVLAHPAMERWYAQAASETEVLEAFEVGA